MQTDHKEVPESEADCNRSIEAEVFEGGDPANSSKLSKSWVRQPKTESQRHKREAKNLQKYDSNSIDEEEFQDCKFAFIHQVFLNFGPIVNILTICSCRFLEPPKAQGIRSTEAQSTEEGNTECKLPFQPIKSHIIILLDSSQIDTVRQLDVVFLFYGLSIHLFDFYILVDHDSINN